MSVYERGAQPDRVLLKERAYEELKRLILNETFPPVFAMAVGGGTLFAVILSQVTKRPRCQRQDAGSFS